MTKRILAAASMAFAFFVLTACGSPPPTESIEITPPAATLNSRMVTEPLGFDFEGKRYAGLLDMPSGGEADGLVLLVHGSGRTNVASGNSFKTLRELLTDHGLAVYAYDKAGNGDSEGEYNSEQPVENSAQEALAAIAELRARNVPGADKIGLWGISRAGWINPLIIAQDPEIVFWISVSGPGPLSNMEYLLESNWRLQGYDQAEIETRLAEWHDGFNIQRNGGSYSDYRAATPTLADDPLLLKVRGEYNEDRFLSYQAFLQENPPVIDAETGLIVFVEEFQTNLNSINIPVLALFGERDTQVDWQASKRLYERTIGENANLSVTTLPDCNHFMRVCEDCGFGDKLEKVTRVDTGDVCPNFYPSMSEFLLDLGFEPK